LFAAIAAVVSAVTTAAITTQMSWALAQPQPERVAAREFVVIDVGGNERASFGIREGGMVNIRFNDTTGAVRMQVGAGAQPLLTMFGPSGRPGFRIGTGDNGEGAAIIMGPNNELLLQAPRPNQGFLLITTPGGLISLGAGSGSGEPTTPRFTMFDLAGDKVEIATADGPSIILSQSDEILWQAP
jgi:hypothetical protein